MKREMEVYSTHVKVYNYQMDDNEKIQKLLSTFDKITFSYTPIGYLYDQEYYCLHLPISLFDDNLVKELECEKPVMIKPNVYERTTFKMNEKFKPRDEKQIETIDFILNKAQYHKNEGCTRHLVNLHTGGGKTFCAIYSARLIGYRILIIVPDLALVERWRDFIEEATDIKREDIGYLDTSQIKSILDDKEYNKDITIATHRSLHNVVESYGYDGLDRLFKKMKIGTKIIDECHKEFKNVCMIDLCTNVKRTIYLTATASRSEYQEDKIFQRVFKLPTLSFEVKSREENHINMAIIKYNSKPTHLQQVGCQTQFGLSGIKFMSYTMKHNEQFLKALDVFMKTVIRYDDKRAIIYCGTKKMIWFLKKYLEEHYPNFNEDFGIYCSGIDERIKKDTIENKRFIISTFKSLGTGVDIEGLRFVCMCEPYSSKIIASQGSGRLREKGWYFELIDIGFPLCTQQFTRRKKELIKKANKFQIIEI